MTRRSLLTAAAAPALAQVRFGRKLRVALIGFDGHTAEIFRMLPQLPEVELTAVADAASDPGAIAGGARNPYAAKARRYSTLAELLAREQPDVAAVCNNDGDRASAIVACAAKGIHVIAEKPLAIDRAGLDAVYAARRNNRVEIGMLLPMRFDPQYLAMKQIVADGLIGDALQISAQKSYQLGSRPEWQKNAAKYGSTILWIGIHMIDLMSSIARRQFTEASSYQSRGGIPGYGDMEIVTASVFRLDNGGTATLHMDYLRPPAAKGHGDDRLRIAGTRGVVEYQESTGVTMMADKQDLRVVSSLPPQQSAFLDFLQQVCMGGKAQLSWEEIVRANEYTLAAHEAAATHSLRPIRDSRAAL